MRFYIFYTYLYTYMFFQIWLAKQTLNTSIHIWTGISHHISLNVWPGRRLDWEEPYEPLAELSAIFNLIAWYVLYSSSTSRWQFNVLVGGHQAFVDQSVILWSRRPKMWRQHMWAPGLRRFKVIQKLDLTTSNTCQLYIQLCPINNYQYQGQKSYETLHFTNDTTNKVLNWSFLKRTQTKHLVSFDFVVHRCLVLFKNPSAYCDGTVTFIFFTALCVTWQCCLMGVVRGVLPWLFLSLHCTGCEKRGSHLTSPPH